MCVICVLFNAEPASDMPDTGQTAEAVAADAAEQPVSPIQRYNSYDERPLPAIRRFFTCCLFFCTVALLLVLMPFCSCWSLML